MPAAGAAGVVEGNDQTVPDLPTMNDDPTPDPYPGEGEENQTVLQKTLGTTDSCLHGPWLQRRPGSESGS